ncbi:hypothetical protein [Chitinivorax sp. B]|uniref:hypothetical protein n=1 Tax=Chitinivorax sp. B TaxID=2502235 RepID=UPI0010F859A1|nr:hypothetical protein [Chitinivorax sp. B]
MKLNRTRIAAALAATLGFVMSTPAISEETNRLMLSDSTYSQGNTATMSTDNAAAKARCDAMEGAKRTSCLRHWERGWKHLSGNVDRYAQSPGEYHPNASSGSSEEMSDTDSNTNQANRSWDPRTGQWITPDNQGNVNQPNVPADINPGSTSGSSDQNRPEDSFGNSALPGQDQPANNINQPPLPDPHMQNRPPQ